MSVETTAQVSAPKKAARKSVKGGKRVAKKAKKAPKASRNGKPRAKKEGLRAPQIRVLQVLAKANRGLNRAEISEKGSVDLAMLNSYIGSDDPAIRAKNDKNVCKSLVTLGYVKAAPQEEEGRGQYYAITAPGRKALEKALMAEK